MLERPFNTLMNSVLAAETSHEIDSREEAMFARDWEFIFNDFEGWVILGISSNKYRGYWVHPRLYPTSRIEDLKKTLPEYDFQVPSAAYGEVISGNNHRIEPFWDKSSDFADSEIDLYYWRQYYGRSKGDENYFECNQLIPHTLGYTWVEAKKAYCIINDSGEEVEKIKVIDAAGVQIVLMRRQSLDKLLYLGKWVLVRYTSFTRWRTDHPDFQTSKNTLFTPHDDAKFSIRACGDKQVQYIEIRGADIQRPVTPIDKVLNWNFSDEEEEKRYADFIVEDWKNKRILKNYSIQPSNFANYFTESDLPFETSPIYFKPEVLEKYKNNPDKYELTERTITCRGGWYLKTYDVNEHNQVHTYAVYLSSLPYKEQLYWLAYNEEPKGTISKRAFKTDFEAQWPDASPLEKLNLALETLGKLKFNDHAIWEPKGGSWETASKGLHYLHTENANQWHDFIIALANTTNEGFQLKTLKLIAAKYGEFDDKLKTLGLIRHILTKTGNESHIANTHKVLSELQDRRAQGKAHGTWDAPKGSLIEDAKTRLNNVINAIEQLDTIFTAILQALT
jgi:hypothetical protein